MLVQMNSILTPRSSLPPRCIPRWECNRHAERRMPPWRYVHVALGKPYRRSLDDVSPCLVGNLYANDGICPVPRWTWETRSDCSSLSLPLRLWTPCTLMQHAPWCSWQWTSNPIAEERFSARPSTYPYRPLPWKHPNLSQPISDHL